MYARVCVCACVCVGVCMGIGDDVDVGLVYSDSVRDGSTRFSVMRTGVKGHDRGRVDTVT